MIGESIAHYRVTEKIGEGGMGEVYRARDTKLNRDVALKILPQVFAQDSQRMARFEREAQVLASLNHSHIAQIHGLEETDGTKALVLELVEGETLAEQIARGPVAVDEALKIALQICEGLEAAHEKGIIHRDLKPANIKITPEGEVKILDFGLAKALEGETPVSDLSHSPTITHAPTEAGVILGTVSYMSPEQARGKPVDKRADVWAFGCVLYEMLTGKKAFGGAGITDVIASLVREEPTWEILPKQCPQGASRVLRRCLAKNPRERVHDIADVRIELFESINQPSLEEDASREYNRAWKRSAGLVSAGVLLGAMAAISLQRFSAPPAEKDGPTIVRATLELSGDAPLKLPYPSPSISRDGNDVVYVANLGNTTQLYRRSLEQKAAEPIPGTEGVLTAFLSPDGNRVGFATSEEVKTVSLRGNEQPLRVCAALSRFGGDWGLNDWIILPTNETWGLSRVVATDGEPQPLSESLGFAAWPEILPDGETVIFTSESSVCLVSIRGGDVKTLPIGGKFSGIGSVRYVSTGHLLYGLVDRLMAVPFDLERLEVTGTPVPVVDNVRIEALTAGAQYDVSENGTLIYVPGGSQAQAKLTFVDRNGAVNPLPFASHHYVNFRLSPEGKRVAVSRLGTKAEIFIYDLNRYTEESFASGGTNISPVWSPDGKKIAFASDRNGTWGIYIASVENPEDVRKLSQSELVQEPAAWSPDGTNLAFVQYRFGGQTDIGLLPVGGKNRSEIILDTPLSEIIPTFSPDGRYLAYLSSGAGRFEVYVQQLPKGKKVLVTNQGGEVLWSADGKELFIRRPGSGRIVAVPVETAPDLEVGTPRELFEFSRFVDNWWLSFDVSPDGNRFLLPQQAGNEGPSHRIEVVVNWFEELKRLVPTE